MSEQSGKRSKLQGALRRISSNAEESERRAPTVTIMLLQATSTALLKIVERHMLTVTKFGGMTICEGCGELAGPEGDLCEELQVIWDIIYPEPE